MLTAESSKLDWLSVVETTPHGALDGRTGNGLENTKSLLKIQVLRKRAGPLALGTTSKCFQIPSGVGGTNNVESEQLIYEISVQQSRVD